MRRRVWCSWRHAHLLWRHSYSVTFPNKHAEVVCRQYAVFPVLYMLSFFFINCIIKYCCLFCWRPAVMASALRVAFRTLFTCLFIFVFGFCAENKFFFFFFFYATLGVCRATMQWCYMIVVHSCNQAVPIQYVSNMQTAVETTPWVKKTGHHTLLHNFAKSWPIYNIHHQNQQ